MRKTILLLFALCTFCCHGVADGFKLNSRQVTTADGLAGNTINELVQDEEGFIWLVTNNGLSRFDGFTTVNYTSLSTDDDHRMEARVGRIYCDNSRGLLWLSTATYQNACYDLRRARFTDWTGRGDHYRQQNKLMMTTRGMVLYGMSTGATLADTDFRKANGALPSDNVLTVVEDSSHNIWLPTDKGIAVLTPDGKAQTVDRTAKVIAAATTGQTTWFLHADGTATGYDTRLKPVLRTQLPPAIGRPQKVNTSFVWQGRWMLFTPDGTYAMNIKDGRFEKPAQWQIADGLSQGYCPGYHLIANRTGRLWLFPDSGSVKTLDLIPEAYYTTNKGRKFNVARTGDGRLFIATYGNGLFVYTPGAANEELRHYGANDEQPVIGSDYLLCAMTDRQGNVWVGSESAGAYCLSVTTNDKYSYIQPHPGQRSNWDNTVSWVGNLKQGGIAIGTRRGHVYTYHPATNLLTATATHKASVNAHVTDSKGRTWTGTWGDGLYIDGQRHSTTDSLHHIPSDFISDILEDRQGRIWVATWNAGLLLMGEDGITPFMDSDINSSRVNDLVQTSDGSLWVASNNGLSRIKGGKREDYNTTNKKFPADEVRALLTDNQGTLWAACAGSGVVRCMMTSDGSISSTKVITTHQGLANNGAASLLEDSKGYIWVGTEDGISRINPHNDIVNSYRFANTPLGNTCFNNCAAKGEGGEMMFGTIDGLLVIRPEAFVGTSAQRMTAGTRITDVSVNGVSIHEMGLLEEAMSYTTRITLAHDQNSLRISFSDFEYDWQNQRVFQYYLEDVERQWQSTTPDHYADYSELQPGRYTFHLRSLNAEGEWNDEVTLQIVIRQPWWNTWWAWLFYLLLVAGAAYYVYRNWRDKFMLHQQMKMDQQLMEFRTGIFTNITHEFRTPLSIIKGAVDKLSMDSGNKAALQTAQRGTSRLLRLVNQLMEYRKINTGNLRLQVEEGDIVTFVRNLYQDFLVVARQKDIQMIFQPFDRHFLMPFDRQMVETIVYNLLSNAVKYTPDGGSVSVKMKKDSSLKIIVQDTGHGISPEKQAELFKPFMHGYASQGGMGIGLYNAHQMAQLHKGTLTYDRTDDATLFTLTLPTDASVYAPDDYREAGAISDHTTAVATQQLSPDIILEMQPESYNDMTVAVIEDNPDMMQQIRQEIGVYFRTTSFSTGQAGYDSIVENPPSLLVCDVMLPDTDGYQIVSRLKADPRTASMPIIMLTALDDEEHQIRAYRAGADDYMVKPCNFRLLIARAIQLIKWRMAQKPTHTAEGGSSQSEASHGPSTPADITIIESHQDKLFKEKLEVLTARHLAEENFSIDRLAELTKMGRTKFYGKVKELTGMSPNKYLQEARMKLAAQLLLEGELTVAEVSYKVGIQDPSYFNKVFKARYGVVPSKYGKTERCTEVSWRGSTAS